MQTVPLTVAAALPQEPYRSTRPAPPVPRNGPLYDQTIILGERLATATLVVLCASHPPICFRCGAALVDAGTCNRRERRDCPACGLAHWSITGFWDVRPAPWPATAGDRGGAA